MLNVPESNFTFNELIRGQAEGDLAALESNGRTVLSVDLGEEPQAGLDLLLAAIKRVVS